MGRPRSGRAMTSAERQRRYLDRKVEALAKLARAAKPPEPKAATDDQARALDDALAKLEIELAIERKGLELKPRPGEWCAAFSVAGLEAVASHLDALKARIAELEAERSRAGRGAV